MIRTNIAREFNHTDLAVNGNAQAGNEAVQREVERLMGMHPVLKDWGVEFICIHPARSSEVLEYRRRGQPEAPHLIVKHRQYRMSGEESSRALAGEFHTLEALWNRADASFRETIPRPVALLSDAGAAVFEAVRGKPMTQLLRQEANCFTGVLCSRRTSRLARQAGEWLRNFHEMTARPPVKHNAERYFLKLSYWLRKGEATGLAAKTVANVWEAANKARGNMEGELTHQADVHGDFIPQNILAAGKHVAVIDFECRKQPEDVHEDLGFFVAYLRVLAGSRAYSRRALKRMEESFLEGYGDLAGNRLLSLYVLKAMTTMFADQVRPEAGNGSDSRRAQYMRSQLDLAARELSASSGVRSAACGHKPTLHPVRNGASERQ
jgi:aminoglycoside phosphotransferase (APT) family kinase protein